MATDPTPNIDALAQHDSIVRERTLEWLRSSAGYLGMMDRAFALNIRLLDAVAEASQTKRLPDGPMQAVVVLMRTRQHFWIAWNALLAGHYLDCLNAIKIAHESYLLAGYLARNAAEARAWQNGKKVAPRHVRGALPAEVASEVDDVYGNLCNVAHPNSASVGMLLHPTEASTFRRLPDFVRETASHVLRRFRREFCYSLTLLAGLLMEHTAAPLAEEDNTVLFSLMPPEHQEQMKQWEAAGRPPPPWESGRNAE